jgi:predicted dehydrogenase
MSVKPLQVGIIGIGLYATVAHVPQLRATGMAEVIAVSRRNAERLEFIRQQLGIPYAYTDWRELLKHPGLDAVVISTPHHVHAEQGLAALEQGLHVLMEKPMALAAEDAWKLVDAAQQRQKTFLVGYNRRFMGLWQTLREKVQSGAIGQLRQINLQIALYRKMYWAGQSSDEMGVLLRQMTGWPGSFFAEWESGQDWHSSAQESGGGMFSNSGAHLVDLVLWLAGGTPSEIVAFSESAGMPAECFLNIQARLTNGVLLSLTFSDVEPGGFAGQGSLILIGEAGIASFDISKPNEVWITRQGASEAIVPKFADTNAAAAFVSAICEGGPNLSPPQDGAYAVAFSEAVYRSAAEKRIITVQNGLVRA